MFNTETLHLNQAVRVINFIDPRASALTAATVADVLDEGGESMLEAMTMQAIEAGGFSDYALHQNDMLMEAIDTTRNRVSQTMRAFIRALNQKLSGTGITAGNDTAGDADDGTKSIGGASVGRVRKVQGLAILPAIIPLSDGQTVTIMFHSPSGDQGRIAANDTLVAFQFLLNKKDVTHVVAPMGGQDMSLSQVTMSLSNLIEKNTEKFQRNQKRQLRMKDDLAAATATLTNLASQEPQLNDALTQANSDGAALQNQLSTLQVQIDQQDEHNSDLENQIAALQNKIKTRGATGGSAEDGAQPDDTASDAPSDTVPLSSVQTNAMLPTLRKASVSGVNALWYSQSQAFDIKASGTMTLNGQRPDASAISRLAQFRAAQALGYKYTNFRISGLQGIWVFVKDGQVLTKNGMAKLVAPEPAPVPEPEQDPQPEPAAAEEELTPFARAVQHLAALSQHSEESVSSWAEALNLTADDLQAFADYASKDDGLGAGNISALKNAIDFGQKPHMRSVSAQWQQLADALGLSIDQVQKYVRQTSPDAQDMRYLLNLLPGLGEDQKARLKLAVENTSDLMAASIYAQPDDHEKLVTMIRDYLASVSRPTPKKFIEQFLSKDAVKTDSNPLWIPMASAYGLTAARSRWMAAVSAGSMPAGTPLMDAIKALFDQVKTGATSQPDPQPLDNSAPEPDLSEADSAAQQAIAYLQQVISMESSDMAEIRDARGKVRAAISALTAAGKFDENEDLANQAAQHLSDLLVAIQRAGATA